MTSPEKSQTQKGVWDCDYSWSSLMRLSPVDANYKIIHFTRFSKEVFLYVFRVVEPFLNQPERRGFVSPVSKIDQLFITLSLLAHGFDNTALSSMFNMSKAAVSSIYKKVIKAIAPVLKKKFIKVIDTVTLRDMGWRFPEFLSAVGVADTTELKVAPSDDNGGEMKFLTFHACKGLVMHISRGFCGSDHDFSVFCKSQLHQLIIKHFYKEGSAIMCSKEFIGIEKLIPYVIIPNKEICSIIGLSKVELQENRFIERDGKVTENFYRRMKIYWKVLFRSSEFQEDVEDMFVICVALTNILIHAYPLKKIEGPENTEKFEADTRLSTLI